MAKDVFVSYSSHDKVIADKVSMILEELGLDCWIAPRDIPPGTEFEVAILDGIDQCQAMVVVLTPEDNVSVFVKNEVNRAFSRGKSILTFRVEDIKSAKALEFYLARHQWTDGFPPPVDERVARMARALLELLGRGSQADPVEPVASTVQTAGRNARAECLGCGNVIVLTEYLLDCENIDHASVTVGTILPLQFGCKTCGGVIADYRVTKARKNAAN